MTTPASLLDRFTFGELLGAGGMGEVYAGYDRRDARPVAIKRLRAEIARDPEALQRFSREGALLRTTAHPNIVSVYAVMEDAAGPCIVMELVPGGTLQQLMTREGQLPLTRVLGIALDLSDALARAHRMGIVHRDIKPGNVLLAEDGSPKLTDFGIASMMLGNDRLTGPGAVVGTLPYLSPEGWDGEPPDARSDIWSLGVMLYELLAGRRPFQAGHAGMLLAAITTRDPPRLDSLRPDLPASLVSAIHAMLARDPADRMGSVRELGLVVEQLLRDGGDSTPPRRAAVAPSTPAGRLPRPTTSLIGRERDLAELARLLADPALRMLTLSGPGGSGKTRLAIAAASRLAAGFPDGVVYLDITPIRDAALVLPALARVLGVEEDLNRPLVELIAEQLGAGRRLIVVDNFEQVVEAAADLVRLLERAPGVTLLLTSRFLPRVAPGHEYAVTPLPVPESGQSTSESLAANEAVQLFLERSRALNPRLETTPPLLHAIAEICRRLDGLPLAIELAAARSRVLPPAAMLPLLARSLSLLTSGGADRLPHHRTLRQTIEWSVQLLEERDRRLFAMVAIFAGGWSLDDAEAVIGPAGPEWSLPGLVDALQSLIEKNLIMVQEADGEPRYGLLETLREYAREQLAASPDAAPLARRHAAHFAARAEQWNRELASGRQSAAMDRFTRSLDNLRATLAWLGAHQPEALPDLVADLGRYWYSAGLWHEALAWYDRALLGASEASPSKRTRILDLRARLEMFLGDESSAVEHHELAWSLAQKSSDPVLKARSAEGLGEVMLKVGRLQRATDFLEQAVQIARTAAHPGVLAESLTTLATARVGFNHLAEAEALLHEALDWAARQGDRFVLGRIHYYLAGLALLRDDAAGSRHHCEDGRRAAAESGDQTWVCHLDEMLARALVQEREWDPARTLISHSLESFHAVGSRSCLPHSFEAAARLSLARHRDEPGQAGAVRAARLLGGADHLCHTLSIAMLPVERALLAHTLSRVRSSLDAAGFEAAWREGRGRSEEETLREVRNLLEDEG